MANPKPTMLDEILSVDAVDQYKRVDCRRYENCLDTAAINGWQQFHCNACDAYVQSPKDDPASRKFAQLGRRWISNGYNSDEEP